MAFVSCTTSATTVTLDGNAVEAEVRTLDDGVYVSAAPIFHALHNDVTLIDGVLTVKRSQDGVAMALDTATGIVSADGKDLGKLNTFGEVGDDTLMLTPNAISVLSGANGRFDEDADRWDFELDPRLRVSTGFDVFVNGRSLISVDPAPRAVGPVMLLPLLPIAEELGHVVTVADGIVSVRRAQDSAVIELALDTGLISLRGVPYGLSRDVSYIDEVGLLLPSATVEALTGTHVYIEAGSSRIEIDLDERLTGGVEPGDDIFSAVAETPFLLETLDLHLGPNTVNTVSADFRVRGYNGRLRLETPDLPSSGAEIEPSWLSVDFAHVSGVKGSVGDYSADLRELDGVGLRRIRGAAVQVDGRSGRWAAAAGTAVESSRRISRDQSRLDFGGWAAGVRYADARGWEAGLSARGDAVSDDQMAVLSAISGRLGRVGDKPVQWDAQADLGVFSGTAREGNVDVRLNTAVRAEATQTLTLQANLDYEGREFLRTDLVDESRRISDTLDEDLDGGFPFDSDSDAASDKTFDGATPDVRRIAADALRVGASLQYAPEVSANGILRNPAAAIRLSHTETGILAGGAAKSHVDSIALGLTTALGDTGVNVSADYNAFVQGGSLGEGDGTGLSIRAFKRFERGFSVRAQYDNDRRNFDGELSQSREALSVNVAASGVALAGPKSSSVILAPSLTGIVSDSQSNIRAGVIAQVNSGALFGQDNLVTGTMGALQSYSSVEDAETDYFLTLAYARKLALGRNLSLGLAYQNDFGGRHRLALQLDGHFDFNDARRYTRPIEGTGVLTGRAFIDGNRDGMRQDDERVAGGVMLRLARTPLSLRTDQLGNYTIQNVKAGLYDMTVDARTLPLGYGLSDEAVLRATIAEGRITTVDVPIVQRGQLRGFVYRDENGDGEYQRGETRPERVELVLSGDAEDTTQVTTTFGQFAFDDLSGASYDIIIDGEIVSTIALNSSPDLMSKIAIALPAKDTEVVEAPPKAEETVLVHTSVGG